MRSLLILFIAWALSACDAAPVAEDTAPTLAFGSCLRQWQDQPVWDGVLPLKPQAFIFLGDNVYTDVGSYKKMAEPGRIGLAYQHLAAHQEFQRFLQQAQNGGTEIYATWDDHDYGLNDGGADYPHKLASKQYFKQFFQPGDLATADTQPGIHHARLFDWDGLRVQLLLLDTRSFRSPMKMQSANEHCRRNHPAPNREPGATVLGEAQWQWLEGELKKPADLRILASSIQVLPTEHCFEKWQNFPEERARLIRLIGDTRANGLVIISGDRHLAEISRLDDSAAGYPLYEITASGLNSAIGRLIGGDESNRLRATEHNTRVDNFGSLQRRGDTLHLQIRDTGGKLVDSVAVPLELLDPR